jgi:glycosyltransferase involved in cell wall biosynthesis
MLARLGGARATLLLLGDGPLAPELRSRAARLGLGGRVRFAGLVAETVKFELLAAADVYVSTSQHEGFGLVFLEAMASGLPIVCYDRGGHTDFLADGETGGVVPLNALDAFVASCKALIESPERRAAVGRANRARAEVFFIDRCAERYEELFESVIQRRAPVRGRYGTVDNRAAV